MDGLEFKSKINVWANAKQIQNQTKTSKKKETNRKKYTGHVLRWWGTILGQPQNWYNLFTSTRIPIALLNDILN